MDERDRGAEERRPSGPRHGGSTARRFRWALLGMVAYALAKYVFGF